MATTFCWLLRDESWRDFQAHLSTNFDIRRTKHIGFGEGCVTEMEPVKRPVRLNPDPGEIDLEADPTHVKKLPCQRRREDKGWTRSQQHSCWTVIASLKYRSGSVKAAYLAVDRTDFC